jgi:Aerobic-type carbon monoxide dehydrogenase, middle subunit CoxM/CutM homologs
VNLAKALEIRSKAKTIVFAGGSDLMVKHRTWSGVVPDFSYPLLLIGHLEQLQGITITNNILKIGAACTLTQVLNDKRIPDCIKLPISQMASPSIRNIGTIGGNICNSSPAGDTLPMLYALDARLVIQTKNNTCSVSIAEFITGPGQNKLKPDEILSQIIIPLPDYNCCFYRKVGSRKANSISKLSFFGLAKANASHILEVKIAMGAVSPTVIRSLKAETLLKDTGRSQIPQLLNKILAYYDNLLNPIDDLRSTREYRKKVSLQLLENFLVKELA